MLVVDAVSSYLPLPATAISEKISLRQPQSYSCTVQLTEVSGITIVPICRHWGREGTIEPILSVKDGIFTDTGLDDVARLSEQLKALTAISPSLSRYL
jgi:hypothetical protein